LWAVQGQALVRAIETKGNIEPTDLMERVQAWFLLQAYRRGLTGIVELASEGVAEEILSASERIRDDRAAVGLSETPLHDVR
jgi:hypothetical protein